MGASERENLFARVEATFFYDRHYPQRVVSVLTTRVFLTIPRVLATEPEQSPRHVSLHSFRAIVAGYTIAGSTRHFLSWMEKSCYWPPPPDSSPLQQTLSCVNASACARLVFDHRRVWHCNASRFRDCCTV